MASYTYPTLATAQSDLSARLYDATSQLWPAVELTFYITEAIRNWNALANFWRSPFTFPLAGNKYWYDITQLPGSIRPYTVTDAWLLQLIEYHLLEPSSGSYPLTWGGSLQFNLSQILNAMTARQNEVLGTTGCTISTRNIYAPIARTGIVLPNQVTNIRRVTWFPNSVYPNQTMRQADSWSKRAFDSGYTSARVKTPETWLQSTQQPPSFDVDSIPNAAGTYEVLSTDSGNVFSTAETAAQKLSIPDDWSWLLKWGTLFDLLSGESNAKDNLRAQYCYKRFAEGVMMLSRASAILDGQINGLAVPIDAVENADRFNAQWQSIVPASQPPWTPPDSIYTTGLNLVATPLIDSNPGGYSALLTVVQNAPVPVNAGDPIKVTGDIYDALIDMAQHIAMFKVGGAEFAATIPLYQSFLTLAAVYNSKMEEMGTFDWAIMDISRTDAERNPLLAVGRG